MRVGLSATALVYLFLHLAAAAIIGWLTVRGILPLAAPIVPVLLLLLAIKASSAIQQGVDDRKRLTAAIEGTLAIHTIGSLWLTGCVLYLIKWGSG